MTIYLEIQVSYCSSYDGWVNHVLSEGYIKGDNLKESLKKARDMITHKAFDNMDWSTENGHLYEILSKTQPGYYASCMLIDQSYIDDFKLKPYPEQ